MELITHEHEWAPWHYDSMEDSEHAFFGIDHFVPGRDPSVFGVTFYFCECGEQGYPVPA
jgi:hypothetical protein